ncbi:hypothetical protein Tco_1108270 [Tanacetum coccineum]
MDELIRNRNAKLAAFQQEIDTLKETLSNSVKEKESLSTTLNVFKTESMNEYNTLTRKLFWKNKIKNWKTLFAQQIQPTLYDGSVIAKKHDLISVIDDEETLILEEETPSELPKVSLVNEILKKLKYHLASFDKVVKKRTTFDAITADEITEVQTVFNQMEAVVDQCSCLDFETELLKKKDFIEKDVYDKLDNFRENQNAPTFNQLFEINELKARSQEKGTVIRKLKDRIKSLNGKDGVENVKKDIDEIETINIELEHSVAKLLSENENLRKIRVHLKSIYKDQFDSIKKTRVQSKEHCASLIAQINEKSVENSDLNAQLQEKVFAIAALKNELRKLKGENVVDTAVSKPSATIAPGMFKLDIEPISLRLKKNRDAHEVYLEKTIENTDTLRGLVECARKQNPSEPLLESACMFTKHV